MVIQQIFKVIDKYRKIKKIPPNPFYLKSKNTLKHTGTGFDLWIIFS